MINAAWARAIGKFSLSESCPLQCRRARAPPLHVPTYHKGHGQEEDRGCAEATMHGPRRRPADLLWVSATDCACWLLRPGLNPVCVCVCVCGRDR